MLITTLAVLLAACGTSAPEATPAPEAAAPASEHAAHAEGAAHDEAFAEVSLTELQSLVKENKVVLLDANGTESFDESHIPGALDFAAVKGDLAASLPADKDALVVAYCGGPTCGAWKKAADAVASLGYTQVKHFKPGISGWDEAQASAEL